MVNYIIISFLVGSVAGIAVFFAFRSFIRRKLFESLGNTLFLVKIPKEPFAAGQAEKDFKLDINRFEELLGGLSSLKKPFTFEVAVPHIGEEIHFYIAVPKKMSEVAVKQVQGLWNGASVERSEEHTS